MSFHITIYRRGLSNLYDANLSVGLSKEFSSTEIVFDKLRLTLREAGIYDNKIYNLNSGISGASKFCFTYFGEYEIPGKYEVEKIGDEYIIYLGSKIPVNKLSRNKQPLVNKNP